MKKTVFSLHKYKLLFTGLAMAIGMTSFGAYLQLKPATSAANSLTAGQITTALAASKSAQTAPAVAPDSNRVAATHTTSATPANKNCVTDSFAPPGPLDLSTKAPGLSTVMDAVHQYQVYGSTGQQIINQISACAPRLSGEDSFTAYTSYNLNWQFQYASTSIGCKIVAAQVGLHLGEVMPLWQPDQQSLTESGLTDRWQLFMSALSTHEQGHMALDRQYASLILTDLQQLTVADCSTMASYGNSVAKHDADLLAQANNNYDAQTNHGATQGAVLPQ